MDKANKRMAWRMLLCSCLLIGGGQGILVGCAGVFIQPVCTANGFGVGPFSAYLSVGAVAMMIGFPLAGKVMAKFPLKPLVLVCSVVNCGIFILYSQFKQLWMFYVAVLFTGLACVIPAFMVGPMVVSAWFEKKRGMAMGIAMACVGVFGAIFSVVGGTLIASVGYQLAYVVLGLCALALMVPASLMIVAHPAMKGMVAYGAGEETAASADAPDAAAANGVSYKRAIKSPSFIFIFIVVFFVVCAGAFSPQVSVMAMSMGYDIGVASSLMSVFMIGGLSGSFILGWLNDKIGVKNTLLLILLLGAGAIGLIVAGKSNLIVLMIGILLLGIAASAGGVQPPLVTNALFGQKDYASIYGSLQIALSLAGIVATPIYGFVMDATGSFTPALIGVAITLVVGVLLTIAAFKGRAKLWETAQIK